MILRISTQAHPVTRHSHALGVAISRVHVMHHVHVYMNMPQIVNDRSVPGSSYRAWP